MLDQSSRSNHIKRSSYRLMTRIETGTARLEISSSEQTMASPLYAPLRRKLVLRQQRANKGPRISMIMLDPHGILVISNGLAQH
jgi:hypothetical protein